MTWDSFLIPALLLATTPCQIWKLHLKKWQVAPTVSQPCWGKTDWSEHNSVYCAELTAQCTPGVKFTQVEVLPQLSQPTTSTEEQGPELKVNRQRRRQPDPHVGNPQGTASIQRNLGASFQVAEEEERKHPWTSSRATQKTQTLKQMQEACLTMRNYMQKYLHKTHKRIYTITYPQAKTTTIQNPSGESLWEAVLSG